MAEDIPATPGWVEERIEQLWAETKIGNSGPAVDARSAYLNCLAGCSVNMAGDSEVCQDVCRQQLMEALHKQGFDAEALEVLEQKLESLEAEITESTLPSTSK